jgi:hypothetical protein
MRVRRAGVVVGLFAATACGRVGYNLVDEEILPTVPSEAGDAASLDADGALLDASGESATPDVSSEAPDAADVAASLDASSSEISAADVAPVPDAVRQDASTPDVASAPDVAADVGTGVVTTIDDSVEGSVLNQFHYVGTGWLHCTSCVIGATYYDQSDSWSNVMTDFVSFSFVGTQLKFYGVLDSVHGIGAASIDGGQETSIDFYDKQRLVNQLLWTSPVLPSGLHTFLLRVTGQKNKLSSDFFIAVDRVDVFP